MSSGGPHTPQAKPNPEAQAAVAEQARLESPPRPGAPLVPGQPIEGQYAAEPRVFVAGNRVAFLRDGAEAYPEMLAAIEAAQRFVHLETFIFADDSTGHRFARALARAAARGVEVTLLYDALGSWESHRGFFTAMRRRGINARPFNPIFPWRGGTSLLRRDHRKLLVVDGKTAFVGGINISDEWAPPEQGGQHWRDDVMRIDGPAVAPLDGVFRATWRAVVRGLVADLRQRGRALAGPALGPVEPAPPAGDVAVAIFAARKAIHAAYLHAIGAATHSVYISTAYFVPDRKILRALQKARKRGVRVAVIVPAKSDHFSAIWAGRGLYGRLLRWGVRIYEWQDRIFHAKSAVVDGAWGTMGSFNLDRWSLDFSHELNAVFCERRVGALLEQSFERDFKACKRITRRDWRARPWWARLQEWFYGHFARWM